MSIIIYVYLCKEWYITFYNYHNSYIYVCICAAHTYVRACMHRYTDTYIHLSIHPYMHTHPHKHQSIHLYIDTHRHTHTHTHTHIHIHIFKNRYTWGYLQKLVQTKSTHVYVYMSIRYISRHIYLHLSAIPTYGTYLPVHISPSHVYIYPHAGSPSVLHQSTV